MYSKALALGVFLLIMNMLKGTLSETRALVIRHTLIQTWTYNSQNITEDHFAQLSPLTLLYLNVLYLNQGSALLTNIEGPSVPCDFLKIHDIMTYY
jgi:hypothetical protein